MKGVPPAAPDPRSPIPFPLLPFAPAPGTNPLPPDTPGTHRAFYDVEYERGVDRYVASGTAPTEKDPRIMAKTSDALRQAHKPDRPDKTDRSTLSRERVIQAALTLVDREGIDALSMRRLGAELGVDPMAVYHYIPNKAALLDCLVDAIMTELGIPPKREDHEAWDAWVISMFDEYRKVLRAHPNALQVAATRPVMSYTGMKAGEAILGELMGAGLATDEAIEVMKVMMTMVVGMALSEVGQAPGVGSFSADEMKAYCERLPNDEFPIMTGCMGRDAWRDWGSIYAFAAETFFAGLKLRLAGREPEVRCPESMAHAAD